MVILYVRDQDGNFVPIKSLKGEDGKSAYESALEGGFIGTYEEFCQAIAELTPNTDHTLNKKNPHEVTAKQVGAIPIIQTGDMVYDMDVVMTHGDHFTAYQTNDKDLGTPYQYDLTDISSAMILSYADGDYGYQIAYIAGSVPYMRTYQKDTGISSWTQSFLSLEGGTLSGRLLFDNFDWGEGVIKGRSLDDGNHFVTVGVQAEGQAVIAHSFSEESKSVDDATVDGVLELNAVDGNPNALVLRKGPEGSPIRVFGEHNKKTGTYEGETGENKTINTGSVGSLLLLRSSLVTATTMFITSEGGFAVGSNTTGDVVGLPKDAINFTDGVLNINGSITTYKEQYYNKDGGIYTWQVL